MRKTLIMMNKPVHFGLSILELSKILMYEYWYDYRKPKHGEKAKLCYMDRDSFIVYIKTDGIPHCVGFPIFDSISFLLKFIFLFNIMLGLVDFETS